MATSYEELSPYERTLMHIDSNYGMISDGQGGVAVGRVESELYPSPQDPGFAMLTVDGLTRAIDHVLPGAVRR